MTDIIEPTSDEVLGAIKRLTALAQLESDPPAITKAMIWAYLHGQRDPLRPEGMTADLSTAIDELQALVALIERQPLDDVQLLQSVAMQTAAHIRTLIAFVPAELVFLRRFYDDWKTGKSDSHLRDAADSFEDAGGAIREPASAPAGEAFTGVEAWDELVNVDDRTSPEEYPDMCLITRDELIDFMQRASAPAGDGAVEQIADIIADHVSGPDIAKGHADAASHRSDQLSAAKAILAALARPRAAVEPFLAAILAQSPNGEPVTVAYHPNGDWSVFDRPRAALGEPVAYLHTLHMEHGQVNTRITEQKESAFGLPGRDYSEEYTVTTTPLYALQSPPAKVEG